MTETKILAKNNKINITIPILKSNIDVENRIVSGWATIDNVDQTGDLVTAEASLNAFSSFRGNAREQHDERKAVGRVLSFSQEPYFTDEGVMHTGIWVNVYISKGAEDTWQKVLDGTLSGFSIGGAYSDNSVVREYFPDFNKIVNKIMEYKLIELSLVDNPGNELCDVVSITKLNEVESESSIVIQNVFRCSEDEIAIAASVDLLKCYVCGEEMNNIGWFEVDDTPQLSIKKILEANITKGGSETMSDENTVEEETVETGEATAEVEAVEDVKEPVETASVVTEAPEVKEVNEPDLANITAALTQIQDSLNKATEGEKDRDLALTKVRESVENVENKLVKQLDDLLEEHKSLVEDVKKLKDGVQGFEKRLVNVEGSTAFQKSLNVQGDSTTTTTRNEGGFWSGSFLD